MESIPTKINSERSYKWYGVKKDCLIKAEKTWKRKFEIVEKVWCLPKQRFVLLETVSRELATYVILK